MNSRVIHPGSALSRREIHVAAGLARGLFCHEIAEQLNISHGVVRAHVTRAGARAGARPGAGGRTCVVDYAYRTGALNGLTPQPRPRLYITGLNYQVLRCLARGLTIAEAAREIGISYEAAKSRVKGLKTGLDARHTAHAVALGWQHRLLGPDPLNLMEDRAWTS